MARLPRYALLGHPQHLIQRGNNRSATFFADQDYQFFLDCLQDGCNRYECAVHAYVLMTNHVHLLASPHAEGGLAKLMQSVGRRFVQYINSRYKRTGTLWEGRYRATAIDTEGYLLTCYRYVELNPVRAGMVEHPGQYRWSSYARNALGKRDPLVRDHSVYLSLGTNEKERRAAYGLLFQAPIDDRSLTEIRDATNKNWALGNDRFRRQVEEATDRRAQPLPKGGKRPGAGRRSAKRDQSIVSDPIDWGAIDWRQAHRAHGRSYNSPACR